MKMLFQSLTNGNFVQTGQFLMLFMVALLLIYLLGEQKFAAFKQYAFLMLILLLCPITAGMLNLYQTPFYPADNLWELLPVTPLLAYGLVIATVKMVGALTSQYGRWEKSVSRRKESAMEYCVILGLSMVLFLCGTLDFGKEMAEKTTGDRNIPANVCEALDTIRIPENDNVKLLAADDVARWVRIYDGKMHLPYGRNLYEPEMTAFTYEVYTEEMYLFHDWVNGEYSLETNGLGMDFYKESAANGFDYLIFAADKMPIEKVTHYNLWAETAGYVIYKLQ